MKKQEIINYFVDASMQKYMDISEQEKYYQKANTQIIYTPMVL